jgi:CRP-like cAMP-binding protein
VAEELLDRIRREIADRLAQSRSAYEESVRLEAALVALDANQDAEQSGQHRRSGRRAPASRPRRRAPRGENRRRILEAVEQNRGASARDIATATGIARPPVATTLAKLVRDGGRGGRLSAPHAPRWTSGRERCY